MTANRSKFTGEEVNSVEKMIEDGLVFEASSKISVATGTPGKWLVRTGSKRVKILTRAINSNGNELDYQVKAGVTVSNDGTPVPINNRNSKDAPKTTVQMFHTPTTSGGTGVAPVYLPGSSGVGVQTVGQFNQDGFVRMLEANTEYEASIVNGGDLSPANVELYIMWAELTDPSPSG